MNSASAYGLVAVVVALCVSGAMACHNPVSATDSTRTIPFYGPLFGKLGFTVNSVGDVNDDGFDDVVLASPGGYRYGEGAVYLVFGRSTQNWKADKSDFNFRTGSDAPASSRIIITGMSEDEEVGYNGIVHGDFNADGISDFIISTTINRAHVVYGHNGPWTSFSVLGIIGGGNAGFTINGVSPSSLMYVGNAGDMNGDGVEDILISEHNGTLTVSYVVFGKRGADRGSFSLSSIDGTNGFKLVGGTTHFGYGIMDSAGDVNADGLADLAIGDYGAGRTYVVFGRNVTAEGEWNAVFDVSTLDGNNGFIVIGPSATSTFGWTVVGAGDINDDGFDDIFIGSNSFGAWAVFGHATPWTESPLNVSLLNGTNGFYFVGASSENLGHSGGNAGDVNGGGVDDLIIGGTMHTNSPAQQSGQEQPLCCLVMAGRGLQ